MFHNLINNLGNEYDVFKLAFRKGKLVDAFETLNEVEGVKSEVLKAFVLILLNKPKRALELLKVLNDESIDFIEKDIYFELVGFCYNGEKNSLEATRYYLKALEINPENFYARYNLTNIYLDKKDYKNANINLLKLIELEPEDKLIIGNLNKIQKFL